MEQEILSPTKSGDIKSKTEIYSELNTESKKKIS
jgi:hypothetical protein